LPECSVAEWREGSRKVSGSSNGAGEGIRTPEPLRDRVLSPPRKCSAPLTWLHPFIPNEGLATPAQYWTEVSILKRVFRTRPALPPVSNNYRSTRPNIVTGLGQPATVAGPRDTNPLPCGFSDIPLAAFRVSGDFVTEWRCVSMLVHTHYSSLRSLSPEMGGLVDQRT
jgi:hypothetical protein